MGYTALKLSSGFDPTKTGFETEELAWEYVKSFRCTICQNDPETEIYGAACDAEWMVLTDEEYLK